MATSGRPASTARDATAPRERTDHPARDRLYEHGQGRDKVCQAERSVEQTIREQPLTSVLIAAGMGAIAGGVGVLCGRYWMRR